jgi:hypothetical protein
MAQGDPDIIAGITAGLLGLLGRLMSMAEERRSPFTRSLLWELPSALGLGWVGAAVGESFGFQGFALMSASIVLSYLGPRSISWGLQRYFGIPVEPRK